MIDLVTFDFWQTLVVDTPENLARGRARRLEGAAAVLARAGRATPAARLEAAYDASGEELVHRFWAAERDLPHREQVGIFLELAAPGVTATLPAELMDEAVATYITPVLELLPGLAPGAGEVLAALRAGGRRLAIVSNTGRTPGVVLRQVLERHGVLGHFEVTSFSDEVGWRKPHPRIFRETLARAGVAPERALHVGDDAVADVAGARAIGMRAGHFRAPGRDGAPEADFVLYDLAELPGRLDALGPAPGAAP